jgi:hypothetical protein
LSALLQESDFHDGGFRPIANSVKAKRRKLTRSAFTVHYGQGRLLNDEVKPFHVIVAGVRYGKSKFGPVWHFKRIRKNTDSDTSLVIGPSYRLLKLENLPRYVDYLTSIGIREGVHFKVNRSQSDMSITLFKTKKRVEHRIVFLSGDNPDSIVGYTASHAWIDEAALMDEEVKRRVIKRVSCPRAKHRRQILVTSTPEGENWFYESYGPSHSIREETGPHSVGPKVLVLHGSTYDNPYLDDDYRDQVREEFSFDDAYYRNYILGEWVSLSKNKFYFSFNQSKNVVPLQLDVKNPNLALTFDFNVGKTAWGVIQEQIKDGLVKPAYCVLKSNNANARNVQEACSQFMAMFPPERFKSYRWVILGDAHGHKRSDQTHTTAYQIIESILKPHYPTIAVHAPRGNPFVAERSICTNRLFSTGRLLIDPSCTEVIKSAKMSESDGKDGIKKPKGKDGDTITHSMEAIDMALMVLEPSEFVMRGAGFNRWG